jgi:hypothetical protein
LAPSAGFHFRANWSPGFSDSLASTSAFAIVEAIEIGVCVRIQCNDLTVQDR